MKLLLLCVASILVCGCDYLPRTNSSVVADAKKIVADELIDPTRPIFTKIKIGYDDLNKSYFVCGRVNSKNRLGIYAGAKNFEVHVGKEYDGFGPNWIDELHLQSIIIDSGSVSSICRKDNRVCSKVEKTVLLSESLAALTKKNLSHIEKICAEADLFDDVSQ